MPSLDDQNLSNCSGQSRLPTRPDQSVLERRSRLVSRTGTRSGSDSQDPDSAEVHSWMVLQKKVPENESGSHCHSEELQSVPRQEAVPANENRFVNPTIFEV